MRRMRWSVAAVLALGVGVQAVAQTAVRTAPVAAPQRGTAPAFPATKALFDGWVAEGKMPGIIAATGRGDAPTRFVASGRIATEPSAPAAGPDSLWRVYSMTKPITGMAAMLLVEDGRLKLDDPVAKFFPGFASMRVLTSPDTSLDTVPAKTPITVRMLMTHTAGLGYSISAQGPLLREYERLGLVPAQVNPMIEAKAAPRRPATLAAFAERVASVPLVAEPGTRWHYSMGLDVLAAVVEKAAGMPFEQFLSERMLRPLKMTSTYWQVPRSEAPRLATNYLVLLGGLVSVDDGARSVYLGKPSFPYGGAGLVSSARDYDRFLHMLQNGGALDGARVMKPETAALGMSNLLPPGVKFESDFGGAAGFGAGGFVTLTDVPNGPRAGTYGWSGAATTQAWVDPRGQSRGVIMLNINPYNVVPVRGPTIAALARDEAGAR